MNSHTRHNGTTMNEIDGVLSAFFKSEMPDPWPELRLPAARPMRNRGWVPQVRSRFALAAAVALLVAGAMLLGGSFRSVQPSNEPHGIPTANRPESSKLELIQTPDGPTMIRITIDDPPAAR